MMRTLISSALAFTILFSQIGIPLYTHYCKGTLESISLFVSNACADHAVVSSGTCCKKDEAATCKASDNNCCDDEVIVLQKEIQSPLPEWNQWLFVEAVPALFLTTEFGIAEKSKPAYTSSLELVHGPPLYILHRALIYYA
jgi:hypothetical protein